MAPKFSAAVSYVQSIIESKVTNAIKGTSAAVMRYDEAREVIDVDAEDEDEEEDPNPSDSEDSPDKESGKDVCCL
jgi:hypothetical protein